MHLLWIAATAAHGADGTVTLPLAQWAATSPAQPPAVAPGVFAVRRDVSGHADRGQLDGALVVRFEVRGAEAAVPVLPEATTLLDATLDGRPAALRREGGWWVVTAAPGAHELRVGFVHGARTDRFARELDLSLPGGGPTAFDVVVAEPNVTPTLQTGVVTEVIGDAAGTRIRGFLAAPRLALGWERRPTGPVDAGAAHVDARVDAVLTLGDDVVTGTALVALTVREGEIDRITVALPPEVEVLDATGDGVLQWHTDGEGALVVLLRAVADQQAVATVRFQYPVEPDAPVPLRLPSPRVDGRTDGAVGVSAPVGLEVAPGEVRAGRLLEPRDVPASVLDLTADPLRTAFAFDGAAPDADLSVQRQAEVGVSPTRIDDLQGITVVMEDGTEVGKVRLAVRNTARQVLTVDLPPGAVLTHCFRDGVPLRPAATDGVRERVLVPLTRSDPASHEVREHTVAPGEMLSTIAQRYYGNGERWPLIAAANPGAEYALHAGRRLTIPPVSSSAEETAFVLELGWERRAAPMGLAGVRTVALPTVDLELMAANWHLYLPDSVVPVWLSSRGVARAADRGRVGRLLHTLFADAGGPSVAYAGEGYANALESRRSTYLAEQEAQAETVGHAFPLVGTKHRLHGVLLGTEAPRARVVWLSAGAVRGIQWLVSIGVAALAAASCRVGWRAAAIASVAGAGAAAVVAAAVPGVFGAALWGLAVGLALGLVARRRAGAVWVPDVRWRWGSVALVTLGGAIAMCVPVVGSVVAAAGLTLAHWRHR